MLVIDGANVIGSRPDGWWRDRAAAATRLHAALARAIAEGSVHDRLLDGRVVLVLEGAARDGVRSGAVDGIEVVHAPASGDDTIVEVVRSSEHPALTTLVTADRELIERARKLGASSHGPTWLLDQIERPPR